ncbi:hypothetical protein BDN67DRAFT_874362, partial [Paxillus ammoniavirescens]
YKLHKHIGKALQTQSAAIQTAIGGYNITATVLSPPCCTLTFEEVIEYTFLTNFDLLHCRKLDF